MMQTAKILMNTITGQEKYIVTVLLMSKIQYMVEGERVLGGGFLP